MVPWGQPLDDLLDEPFVGWGKTIVAQLGRFDPARRLAFQMFRFARFMLAEEWVQPDEYLGIIMDDRLK